MQSVKSRNSERWTEKKKSEEIECKPFAAFPPSARLAVCCWAAFAGGPVHDPDDVRADGSAMYARKLQISILVCAGFCTLVVPVYLQSQQPEETLSGPDSHETGQGPHGHLFGEWGGERTGLEKRGIHFDLQYVSDSLSNVESDRETRFASWNLFRGTVDIDFGALVEQPYDASCRSGIRGGLHSGRNS